MVSEPRSEGAQSEITKAKNKQLDLAWVDAMVDRVVNRMEELFTRFMDDYEDNANAGYRYAGSDLDHGEKKENFGIENGYSQEDCLDVKRKYGGENQFAFCHGEDNSSVMRNHGYAIGVHGADGYGSSGQMPTSHDFRGYEYGPYQDFCGQFPRSHATGQHVVNLRPSYYGSPNPSEIVRPINGGYGGGGSFGDGGSGGYGGGGILGDGGSGRYGSAPDSSFRNGGSYDDREFVDDQLQSGVMFDDYRRPTRVPADLNESSSGRLRDLYDYDRRRWDVGRADWDPGSYNGRDSYQRRLGVGDRVHELYRESGGDGKGTCEGEVPSSFNSTKSRFDYSSSAFGASASPAFGASVISAVGSASFGMPNTSNPFGSTSSSTMEKTYDNLVDSDIAAMAYDNNFEDTEEEEIVVDGESEKAIAVPPRHQQQQQPFLQPVDSSGSCFPTSVSRGYGGLGALGHSMYHRELLPKMVEGSWDGEKCHIATSGTHIAAVTKSGKLYIWGRDEREGRLGLGPGRGPDHQGGLSTPSEVKALPEPVTAVSCDGFFTMALTKEGQLWNWGANSNCELDRDDKIGGWKPQPVPSLRDVSLIQIASGGYHSLALTEADSAIAVLKSRRAKNQPLPKDLVVGTLVRLSSSRSGTLLVRFLNGFALSIGGILRRWTF